MYRWSEFALLMRVRGAFVANTSLRTLNWSGTSASNDIWSLIPMPRGKRSTMSYHLFIAVSSLASWDSVQETSSTFVTTCCQWFAKDDSLSFLLGISTSATVAVGQAAKTGLKNCGPFEHVGLRELSKICFQTPFSQGSSMSTFLSRFNHNFSMVTSEGSSTWSTTTWHSSILPESPSRSALKSTCKSKTAPSPPKRCFGVEGEASEGLSIRPGPTRQSPCNNRRSPLQRRSKRHATYLCQTDPGTKM